MASRSAWHALRLVHCLYPGHGGVIWLPYIQKLCRAVRAPISGGSGPVKSLLYSARLCIFVRRPISGGIRPRSELLSTLRRYRFVSLPKAPGSVPVKLFWSSLAMSQQSSPQN